MRTCAWCLALAFLIACGEEPSAGLDAGADAGRDSGVADAGADAGLDAGPDGGRDAGGSTCVDGPPPPIDDVAVTDQGFVRGHAQAGTVEFLGIPYAAAPIGDRRWRAPESFGCFEGLFEAASYGPSCPQLDEDAFVGDEDCLQLNVWTPSVDQAKRPVLFFIHGGGNVAGAANTDAGGVSLYGGDRLALATDSVVVTIQYRLGQLGWLVDPSLDDQAGRSGNYGTLDQIAALEWVKRNIEAFGGDPERVLLFGESAGAVNTCMLFVSPLADGLFSAALMESGGCPGYARAQVEGESQMAVQESGCATSGDVASCLRDLDAETIIRSHPAVIQVAGRSTAYQPHVDGYVIPEAPEALIESGRRARVPFVIGANSDETARAVPPIQTEQEYRAAVIAQFGSAIGALVLGQYPAASYPSPRAAYVRLSTDAKFMCPSRALARAAASAPGVSSPVYRYVFSHALDNGAARAFGAWHGLELTFVFGALEVSNYTPSADEVALSSSMQDYWSAIARDGAPGTAGGPEWETYRPGDDNFLRFEGGAIGMDQAYRGEDCDFWDDLNAQLGN